MSAGRREITIDRTSPVNIRASGGERRNQRSLPSRALEVDQGKWTETNRTLRTGQMKGMEDWLNGELRDHGIWMFVEAKLWCDRLDGQRGNDDVHHAERRVWQ